jgi:hypothetical protein
VRLRLRAAGGGAIRTGPAEAVRDGGLSDEALACPARRDEIGARLGQGAIPNAGRAASLRRDYRPLRPLPALRVA